MTRFRTLQSLGRGGFGEVFVCERHNDGKRFAMKRLLPTLDPVTIRRFKREIRLLSALDHPHIVRVVARQLDQEPYHYVMPLYRGSLRDEISTLVGDDARIATIFSAVLDAIVYAHERNVIHRDLKPDNILINSDSDLAVADFGLGRELDSESTRQTISGSGLGTALYMAPEQWRSARNADARSDIYALGRILYELYTGPLTDMTHDVSTLPPGIGLLVVRCTHSDSEKRIQTAGELRSLYGVLIESSGGHDDTRQLESLRAQFSEPGDLDRTELETFLHLLMRYHPVEEGLLVRVVMDLHADVITALYELDPDTTRQLVEGFCDEVSSTTWGFDYTDTIARQCQMVFGAVDDAEIRAMLAACLAYVGVRHNRWLVMKVAAGLIEGDRTPAERIAFLERLGALGQDILTGVGTYATVARLDAALVPLLKPEK